MPRQYASAGAVVTTTDLAHPKVLLLDQVRKNGERQTVAPKGRLESGEAPLLAAIREVAEEAGITDLRYGAYLGQQAYAFVDNDATPAAKTVDWFLFTTPDTRTIPAEDEGFLAAHWLDTPAARQAATHGQFHDLLDRALAVIDWRSTAPLPFSSALDALARHVAIEATKIIASCVGAGVGLCGSAARGDFIDDWSDVDFVAWNLPVASPAALQLADLVTHAAHQHGLQASLHLADASGRDARRSGPLYDMKMRAVLQRLGVDTAVIAGASPTPPPENPATAALGADLGLLHAFAATRLSTAATSEAQRKDTARRVLSVLCSAARQVVIHHEPTSPLRLPDVIHALDTRVPGSDTGRLLREYDAFRRTGAPSLETAERLATQVPAAILALDHQTNPTAIR